MHCGRLELNWSCKLRVPCKCFTIIFQVLYHRSGLPYIYIQIYRYIDMYLGRLLYSEEQPSAVGICSATRWSLYSMSYLGPVQTPSRQRQCCKSYASYAGLLELVIICIELDDAHPPLFAFSCVTPRDGTSGNSTRSEVQFRPRPSTMKAVARLQFLCNWNSSRGYCCLLYWTLQWAYCT